MLKLARNRGTVRTWLRQPIKQSICPMSTTNVDDVATPKTFAEGAFRRAAVLKRLRASTPAESYDVVIIGGGCSGAGSALEASLRGLKVACIERSDYSSGTSSRSTKLLWGGSRYLVQAMVTLFSPRSLLSPVASVKAFIADFKMVMNCHRERKFLLEVQSHLTNWLPIAVPMPRWIQWPPPFNYPLAALGPLGIYPIFFKFVSHSFNIRLLNLFIGLYSYPLSPHPPFSSLLLYPPLSSSILS